MVKLVIQGQTSIGVLPTDSVLEGWKREEAVQGPSKRARCRRRMLTYADVCWRMLAYADVC